MESAYVRWLHSEIARSTVLNDGPERVIAVNQQVFKPVLAEVTLEPSGKVAVFSQPVLDRCLRAQSEGRRLRILLSRVPGHATWIREAFLYPLHEAVWPCVECHMAVTRSTNGQYVCPSCHFVMVVP
jgi:hypothetical protein